MWYVAIVTILKRKIAAVGRSWYMSSASTTRLACIPNIHIYANGTKDQPHNQKYVNARSRSYSIDIIVEGVALILPFFVKDHLSFDKTLTDQTQHRVGQSKRYIPYYHWDLLPIIKQHKEWHIRN